VREELGRFGETEACLIKISGKIGKGRSLGVIGLEGKGAKRNKRIPKHKRSRNGKRLSDGKNQGPSQK